MITTREDIAALIRDVHDWPKQGVIFKDIGPLLADPVRLHGAAAKMFPMTTTGVSKIGAFDARGFVFGSIIAYTAGLPFFMIRKKGKLPGKTVSASYALEYGKACVEIAEDAVSSGDRVLLVDDVLATGGTAAAGVELVRELGASCVGLTVLIELQALGGRERLEQLSCPVATVLTY